MFDFKRVIGLTATVVLASVVSASAAVTVSYIDPTGSTPNSSQLAPNSCEPGLTCFVGPYQGDAGGIRLSPWTGILPAADILTADYFAVIPNTGSPAGAQSTSAEYNFGASPQTFFSLLWGSPDNENKIEFFDAGGSVYTLLGSTVISNLVAPPGVANSVGNIVQFVFDDGYNFNRVVLSSGTRNSFEWANAVVPLPAPFVLLVGALGGLGFVSRKRKAA